MNNTEKITVFHPGRSGGSWSRTSFSAYVYFTDSLRAEDGGIIDNSTVKIRIPSDKPLGIVPGDRVMLGEASRLDFENSFFIREVSDNLKGKNKHIRLLC